MKWESRDIKTIILAHNPKYSEIQDVIDLLSPSEKNRIKILTDGIKRTLQYFEQYGKKVVIVSDNPSFPEILDKRINVCNPFRFFNEQKTSFCTMSRTTWNDKKLQYPYNRAVLEVLNNTKFQIPIRLVDLENEFCNKEKCFLSNKDKMFYIDSNHLSLSGSIKVAPRILQAIEDSVSH